MFEFFKKAEKTIDNQVEELKGTLSEILDDEGRVKPGVTSEQVRAASATVKGVANSYNKIAETSRGLADEYKELADDKAELRAKYKRQGIDDILRKMPTVSALLGY